MLQQLFGNKVHFAPLRGAPRRVLDIGTGPGTWAIEMGISALTSVRQRPWANVCAGKKYPTANVTGADNDISHFPQVYPENVHFIHDDATEEDWGAKKYDFIHTRMLLGCFEDFRVIIKRAFDHLQPGGYMESQEMWTRAQCDDGTLDPKTNKFIEWTGLQDEAAMRLGRPLRIANKLKRWYKLAGFVDVREEIMRIPINGWPKDPRFKMLGKWWARSLVDGIHGFSMMLFTNAFNWTPEQVEVSLIEPRKAIQDKSVHAYHSMYVNLSARGHLLIVAQTCRLRPQAYRGGTKGH